MKLNGTWFSTSSLNHNTSSIYAIIVICQSQEFIFLAYPLSHDFGNTNATISYGKNEKLFIIIQPFFIARMQSHLFVSLEFNISSYAHYVLRNTIVNILVSGGVYNGQYGREITRSVSCQKKRNTVPFPPAPTGFHKILAHVGILLLLLQIDEMEMAGEIEVVSWLMLWLPERFQEQRKGFCDQYGHHWRPNVMWRPKQARYSSWDSAFHFLIRGSHFQWFMGWFTPLYTPIYCQNGQQRTNWSAPLDCW